jgi:hypothetical protein
VHYHAVSSENSSQKHIFQLVVKLNVNFQVIYELFFFQQNLYFTCVFENLSSFTAPVSINKVLASATQNVS